MAGRVRFYRGAAGTSLPQPSQSTSGSIFIIERQGSNGFGDMYVDMDNGRRLHIAPDNSLVPYYKNNDSVDTPLISNKGTVYFFEGDQIESSWVAVGDGTTPIVDLPKYTVATRNIIQQKVNAYLGSEYLDMGSENLLKDIGADDTSHLSDGLIGIDGNPSETLVLSRELWLNF